MSFPENGEDRGAGLLVVREVPRKPPHLDFLEAPTPQCGHTFCFSFVRFPPRVNGGVGRKGLTRGENDVRGHSQVLMQHPLSRLPSSLPAASAPDAPVPTSLFFPGESLPTTLTGCQTNPTPHPPPATVEPASPCFKGNSQCRAEEQRSRKSSSERDQVLSRISAWAAPVPGHPEVSLP